MLTLLYTPAQFNAQGVNLGIEFGWATYQST